MTIKNLPVGTAPKALEVPHFPTRLQAFIWRNWGMIPVEKIAKVLLTLPPQVEKLAAEMGLLADDSLCPIWRERGYITIIRRNWHLLPYEQLLELLEMTPDELAYVLKEDDFLWHKLGNLKPQTTPIYYAPLTTSEIEKTAVLKSTLARHFPNQQISQDKPFEFLQNYGDHTNLVSMSERFGLRMSYSYSAIYGDPLLDENLDPYPDGLLMDYSTAGINAVWLQGTLYTLVPWLGECQYSKGWEIRLINLRKLCQRAEKVGIKVYLYLNEPRSMPPDFFETHPDWRGARALDGLSSTLCTSKEPVRNALRDGISELFRNVPELGGLFTITMSENLTNCCSRLRDLEAPCPVCSIRGPAAIIAELNRTLAEGAHRIKPEADVIAWTWGWAPEWDEQAVGLLPKDVKLMCVSETALLTDAMGIQGVVRDYSISKVGPGPVALRLWKKAREHGIGTVAKVQMNNTWECSAVPYIPVPGLVEKHLCNLEAAGVRDLMLAWTLGGYPGGNMELLNLPKEKLAVKKFGAECAALVLDAWDCFDHAFTHFPLHGTAQLYTAPQNCGPMNLLFKSPTGYSATMCGFPYDDLAAWRGNHYPEDVFEEQFRKLSVGWAEGLERLKLSAEVVTPGNAAALADLMNVAEAAYCHFRSAYLQIRFVRLRDSEDHASIKGILGEEIELAKRLIKVILRDSRIGFEASNHYYYTVPDLKEKILNCEFIKA